LSESRYGFGPFELRGREQVLLRSGTVVPVPPKVLATLLVLVEAEGKVVSKNELLERVWPDTFVEENNLTQNISALRKLLAADFPEERPIATLARIGYRFQLPVRVLEEGAGAGLAAAAEPAFEEVTAAVEVQDVLGEEDGRRSRLNAWLRACRKPLSRFFPISRLAASLCMLAALIIPMAILRSQPRVKANSGRRRIAVLGFANLSGSPDMAWLSLAFRETLSTDLGADAKLQVLPVEVVERAERELGLSRLDGLGPETLRRVCADLDCDEVVTGSYLVSGSVSGSATGSQVRLDTHLYDANTGALMGNYTYASPVDEVLPLIAETGQALRGTIGLAPESAASREATSATVSKNREAYRLYLEGLERTRVWDSQGAIELLHRSIELDPDFPLAHLALSGALNVLGQEKRASEEAARAQALDGALSREEQLRIEAWRQNEDHQYAEAAATYKTLFTFYPNNLDYGMLLGSALRDAGRSQEAVAGLKLLIDRAGSSGQDPRLDSLIADCYSTLGDWPQSLAWAERGEQESERRGAKILYERVLTTDSQALYYLHQLQRALAKTEEALTLARQFNDYSGELRALNRIGQIDTALGKMAEARAALEQALAREESLGEVQREIHTLSALGQNLAQGGDARQALPIFERELSLAEAFGQPEFIAFAQLNVARAEIQLGDIRSGRKGLERALQEGAQIGDKEVVAEATKAMAGLRS
jgi:DNA-binding winged helix-turn-helix (wHTH) protein/tetratricopeptide (TPR) repeat protein